MPTQTSPLAGNRTHRTRNPRDITGREYQRLHAEQKAKEDAENIDIAAVRRVEFQAGFDAGSDAGTKSLLDALWEMYRAEGMKAIEEFMAELDEAREAAK